VIIDVTVGVMAFLLNIAFSAYSPVYLPTDITSAYFVSLKLGPGGLKVL
jgi:hypothetical protein